MFPPSLWTRQFFVLFCHYNHVELLGFCYFSLLSFIFSSFLRFLVKFRFFSGIKRLPLIHLLEKWSFLYFLSIPAFWKKSSIRSDLLYFIFNPGKIFQTKEKSYFRLQQTCHGVNEFIRSRKNISVHIYWLLLFQWEKNEASHIFCGGRTLDRMVEIEDDALYGTRFRSLEYSLESLEDFKFDTLCEILKKYRTTASAAAMHRTQLSKDQLVTILNILKPVWISLNSRGSNRYEALLQSKILVGFLLSSPLI